MAVCTGSCKWFDSTKGYGFITTSDGEEVFVHQSEIYARGFRSLAGGEEVQCVVIEDGTGKKKATNVKGIDGGYVRGDADSVRQQSGRQLGGYNGNGGGGYNGNGGGRRMGNDGMGSNSYRPNNNRMYRNNYGSSGGNSGYYD